MDDISLPESVIFTESIDDDYTNVDNTNPKISRCILTFFMDRLDVQFFNPRCWFDHPESIIEIWCGQPETCPDTGRLHGHIYVEFNRLSRPRFNVLKNLIRSVTGQYGDIKTPRRVSKNQRQCAVNYVMKPDGLLEGAKPFIWEGNKVKVKYDERVAQKKPKKVSKEEIILYIESKPSHWTWDQIVHETMESKIMLASCSWGSKFHQGRHAACPRRVITNVVILYGAGGTGKTTIAQDYDKRDSEATPERYYKRNANDGKFWGGGRTAYKNQRIIHLEEFCGQETCANFKEICDVNKSGPPINIKNGGSELNHETVIISSNHHPASWYRHIFKTDDKQWTPVCRRFTKVLFFPEKRPDGSLNRPDEENPPFFYDQTEDFKNMTNDYNMAIDHAMLHWPIREEGQPVWNAP